MSAEHAPEWRQTHLPSGTVRYLVAGAGEPLILLHGLSASVAWWHWNLPAVAANYRVYAIDLFSPSPRALSHFALEETADRLAAWMDVHAIRSANLVGHSMGGYIAASLAAEHPELVAKLVLVNAATFFPQEGPKLDPARLIRWLPTFPPLLAPILLRDAIRAGPVALWEASRDLLGSDLRPKLELIAAPTLVVWGDQDGLLPVELAHELHDRVPHSQLRIIEGVGHNPMWEAPEVFNELVLRFLRGEAAAADTG